MSLRSNFSNTEKERFDDLTRQIDESKVRAENYLKEQQGLSSTSQKWQTLDVDRFVEYDLQSLLVKQQNLMLGL